MDRGDPQIAKSPARQVADDRTKKGMVKISAVVDSGAEANALPENMVDSTEAEFSLDVRKDLPRRRVRSHPCARLEVGDWPNG